MSKSISMILAFVFTLFFLSVAHAQMPAKTWERTITLPNGDVILDMNGEWDVFVENYGRLSGASSYPQIEKITQTGASFEAIRMMDDAYNFKGSQSLKGELDKTGIKRVTIFGRSGSMEAKGIIREGGNKIVIDDGETVKLTLTRK
jgi:hypothetical protein